MGKLGVSITGTVFDKYDTIIFDLDGTIWDCFSPKGDSIGAYSTRPPYSLREHNTVLDSVGNIIKLQAGVRFILDVLDDHEKNLGVMSSGEAENTPHEAQPATLLLRKFDLYKYFNHGVILKRLDLIDNTKGDYVRPFKKTLFIDNDPQNLEDVNQVGRVDVLNRTIFTDWLLLLKTDMQQLKARGGIVRVGVDLPGGETYQDYNLHTDVAPDELLNRYETTKRERVDRVKNQLGNEDEELIFEKGLHEVVDERYTDRPLIPYGSKLAWRLLPDNVPDSIYERELSTFYKENPQYQNLIPVGIKKFHFVSNSAADVVTKPKYLIVTGVPNEPFFKLDSYVIAEGEYDPTDPDDVLLYFQTQFLPSDEHYLHVITADEEGIIDSYERFNNWSSHINTALRFGSDDSLQDSDKVFIYLSLPQGVRKQYTHISNLDEELHVTLAYVPNVTLTGKDKQKLLAAIGKIVKNYPKLKCSLNGLASFNNVETSLVSLVDIQQGAELYTDLIAAIKSAVGDWDREYNFTPHVTLLYNGKGKSNLKDFRQYNWTAKHVNVKFNSVEIHTVELGTGDIKSGLSAKATFNANELTPRTLESLEYLVDLTMDDFNDILIERTKKSLQEHVREVGLDSIGEILKKYIFSNAWRSDNFHAFSFLLEEYVAETFTEGDFVEDEDIILLNIIYRVALNKLGEVRTATGLSFDTPRTPENLLGWLVQYGQSNDNRKLFGVVTSVQGDGEKFNLWAAWREKPEDALSAFYALDKKSMKPLFTAKDAQLGVYSTDNQLSNISVLEYVHYPEFTRAGSNQGRTKDILAWQVHEDSNSKVDKAGNKRWFNDQGQLHRLDGPAIEWADGETWWYQNGKLHRLDGPAAEWVDGSTWWHQNGKLHRLDGPAIEYVNGAKKWYINGDFIGSNFDGFTAEDFENYKRENGLIASQRLAWQIHDDSRVEVDEEGNKRWYNDQNELHRLDGPAIEWADGDKEWHQHDRLHRVDGPAIEWADGDKEWYQHDELHRLDGPAIEWAGGDKEWHINGDFIGSNLDGFTAEDFENYKRENGLIASQRLAWNSVEEPLIGKLVQDVSGTWGVIVRAEYSPVPRMLISAPGLAYWAVWKESPEEAVAAVAELPTGIEDLEYVLPHEIVGVDSTPELSSDSVNWISSIQQLSIEEILERSAEDDYDEHGNEIVSDLKFAAVETYTDGSDVDQDVFDRQTVEFHERVDQEVDWMPGEPEVDYNFFPSQDLHTDNFNSSRRARHYSNRWGIVSINGIAKEYVLASEDTGMNYDTSRNDFNKYELDPAPGLGTDYFDQSWDQHGDLPDLNREEKEIVDFKGRENLQLGI